MDIITEQLVEFYIEQYKNDVKRKRTSGKVSGYDKRAASLNKTLKRMSSHQASKSILEDFHRQIRNLYQIAARHKNKKVTDMILMEMMPELVRLDMALLFPEEIEALDEYFFKYLDEQVRGAICVKSLFELSQKYRRYCIENRITELVPQRPELEFPKALSMNRHFVIHMGPTNSGKTYQALERLKIAKRGLYLGPLRLLALEVYEKMNSLGAPCTMLTGQECLEVAHSRITASTVEMADFGRHYDIAVIDEAQMIEDSDRGHSWTRAILGLLADEIHVCLAPAAKDVIIHLIERCGDSYEIFNYDRKVPLVCENEPFEFPDDICQGDALIVFSKKSVLDVAGRLEEKGVRASVIYGSLPPEIRRRQVQMFAEGKTKVVVATDAIGMGLNLPVRRIVFVQDEKFDGISRRKLKVSEIKQIAGRAGRYGLYDTGYITAVGDEALEYVRERYDVQEIKLETVSLGFPQILLDMDESLDAILKVWHSVKTPAPFVKVSIEETLFLYEQANRRRERIDDFDNKRILYQMISCPIDIKDRDVVSLWQTYCETYTADTSLMFPNKDKIRSSGIAKYETYYKQLDLYYQFSVRLGKVIDTALLAKERARTENAIMKYLLQGKSGYISRCRYCGRKLPVGFAFGVCERCHDISWGGYKKTNHRE